MGYLLIEIVGLLLAFLLVILLFVRKDRKGGLHWYPIHVQQAAIERGLITEKTMRRRKKLASWLILVSGLVIVLFSVFIINGANDWFSAFRQMLAMVLVLNWMDAYFVDYVWVCKTNYWRIPELADICEIGKPVKQILRERFISSIVLTGIVAILACLVFIR